MAVENEDLDLILAALLELQITCVENLRTWNAIGELAERLGGDRSAMWFGRTGTGTASAPRAA